MAASKGHVEVVKILIEHGADVSTVYFGVLDDQVCAEY